LQGWGQALKLFSKRLPLWMKALSLPQLSGFLP
jgi:hypothetical protein